MKTIYKNLNDKEFISIFKSIDPQDKPRLRQGFRELFSRKMKINKNIDPSFAKLSENICKDLLVKNNAIKINDKFWNRILNNSDTDFIINKDVKPMTPYLLKKAGQNDYYGVVRFEKINKQKSYLCKVYDILPFDDNRGFRLEGLIYKVNEEKRQMFSKVFPVNKVDLQGDMMNEEDLRLALIQVVKNGGMEINLEHKPGTVISDNDAIVLETFQIKKDDIIEGMDVFKGDLVSTVQFFDTPTGRELFERIKEGEFKSFSMEGTAERVDI